MADNVPITPGSGATAAADDIGGVHFQRIKLIHGADGTNDGDVSSANPLPVNETSTKTEDTGHTTGDKGTFILGVANEAMAALSGTDLDYTPIAVDKQGHVDVHPRQPQFWVDMDLPGIAAAAYAVGDQYGTLMTISNAARATGGGGWINAILHYDDSDTIGATDFLFFHDTPSLAADNAAFAISDTDGRKTLWIANMGYYTDLGAQRFGQVTGVSVPYFCTATSLYCAAITRFVHTPGAAGTQRIRFGLTRD